MLFLIIFSVVVCGQSVERPEKWGEKIESLSLNNLYKIDEGVYRCEQPSSAGFEELEQYGVVETLNLRSWHGDKRKLRNTQLVLHAIRMNAHRITDSDVADALKIIVNRKGNIVFHCKHGADRTGVICAMYRIIVQGWSREKAVDELINGGYGFHPIFSNIPEYVKNVDVKKIKILMEK